MITNFTYILIILVAILVNIIAIRRFAYDDNMDRTCDDYILNSYLYVILAFLIISLTVTSLSEFKGLEKVLLKNMNTLSLIIILILYLGIYFVFYNTDAKNQIQLHSLWLLLIIMLGVMLFFPLKLITMTDLFYQTIALTLVIVVITSFIGIKYGKQLITIDLDKYLRWALLALIILSIIVSLFPQIFSFMNAYQIIMMFAVPGLIIFTLLLLSYNKKLKERADICHENKNPNYPLESINIFVRIINIMMDVFRILFARRNKKRLQGLKL